MLVVCRDGAGCVFDTAHSNKHGVARLCSCHAFCTGALVAPAAVLTAAHCFWASSNRTGFWSNFRLDTSANATVFVVSGADELASAKVGDFTAVVDAVHGGFENLAQPKDNDIALVFTSSCLSGRATAKMGTPGTESKGAACMPVIGLGWGRQDSFHNFWGAEAPAPLKVTRSTSFIIHEPEVCASEYRRAVADRLGTLPQYNFSEASLLEIDRTLDVTRYVSPDRHVCYGGSTDEGMCFGDSGGPVAARTADGWAVVGVSGWALNKCGIYADFGARVAFFAEWAQVQLERRPEALCGMPLSAAFVSWPLQPWKRSEADEASRCFLQGERWACRNISGGCVAWAQRCDGMADCPDASDESAAAGCSFEERGPPAEDCKAAYAKLSDAFQSSAVAWWELVGAIRAAKKGSVDAEQHRTMGRACFHWLQTSSAPALRSALAAEERELLEACQRNESVDAIRDVVVVYAKEGEGYNLSGVEEIADMCGEQVLYSVLFLESRGAIIEEFVEERQRCALVDGTASTSISLTGWGALAAQVALASLQGSLLRLLQARV